ncbi:HotDog domain-containing protein [Leptodontidium sp. MPI-SDFR-AT-0119]|nr:HotDog domain-containing protein [Leptodontidium sp. MPI-SDFR-AT-0119]
MAKFSAGEAGERETDGVGDVSAKAHVKGLLKVLCEESDTRYNGWGVNLFIKDIYLVSASSKPAGKTLFSFTIQPEHSNRAGHLHGGCCSTIFDFTTTCALAPIAKPGYWAFAGVSRTLNVTYIRPIPVGETVLIESEVVHAGKRLATIKGVMKRKSDGAVMAICEHGKVSNDPQVGSEL